MTSCVYRLNRGLLASLALCLASGVYAQTSGPTQYDIDRRSLGAALQQFGLKAGIAVTAPADIVSGKQSSSLHGRYGAADALSRLLHGSGLVAEPVGDGFVIRRVPEVSSDADEDAIYVTGSRIRGAAPTAQVTILTQEAMRNAGQTNLGDALRSVPQSFGGGQNPGVGIGNPDGISNLSSGSSVNLRGLGADATLTLLNGRRLTYDSALQSVDVSTISFEAVDRVEIVADGASAIYGSDAIGGVVNIILKRDFDGVATSGRWGASTDGGNVQQQYDLTAGSRWGGGGVILSYDYNHATPVLAGQRSYATLPYRTNTLLPSIDQHNLLVSGHQDISPTVHFSIDGLFSRRLSKSNYAILPDQGYRALGVLSTSRSMSWILSPSLEAKLGEDWRATLSGTYGRNNVHYTGDVFVDDAVSFQSYGCYCNSSATVELSAEGALLVLPAGAARLAIGGGYRNNHMNAYRTRGTQQTIRDTLDSYYGYGELFVPVVGQANALPFVYRLDLTAAARYENYPGLDAVATPKFGIIYAPTPDIEIKGSWGKSFKAPTLYQQHSIRYVDIYPTTALGATSYPDGSTALILGGGNPDLTTERATSWSATLGIHPRAIPGLRIEGSYFHIAYRNRITDPLSSRARALADPAYRDLVTFNPSDADKLAAVTDRTVYNNLDGDYDPADVVAIVDVRYLNVAGQTVQGVDLSGDYSRPLGEGATLAGGISGTYLKSRQQLSANQPFDVLAGTLFNPPHWRARGHVDLSEAGFTGSAYLSYIGGVRDVRPDSTARISGMTMLDLTARYTIDEGALSGTSLMLSVQNVFNDKPEVIATEASYFTPYDSTNYSPIGRFVTVSISKRW